MSAAELVELWRGEMLESTHRGHVVVCDESGQIVQCWGDPARAIFPRSACKMLQALPLVESGAADAAGLSEAHLALSCASHQGTPLHTDMVRDWLATLSLGETDLRCGPHAPYNEATRNALLLAGERPCQFHNNCSGKHSGFLTANWHIKGHSEYVEPDHPLQRSVRAAFEDVTGEPSPGYGIDGCSAPNFVTSMAGLARAMARFAVARDSGDLRQRAMARLRDAMRRHPMLVSGPGEVCLRMNEATQGRSAFKSGAEGVYCAILPEQKLGIAIKIEDGHERARNAALVSVLARLGVLEPSHPAAQHYLPGIEFNRRGLPVAHLRLATGFA